MAANVFYPQREGSILFQGKEIATAVLKDGQGYVSIRSLSNALGLDPRAQRKRLMRQQNFFAPYTAEIMITTPGGPQAALCLDARTVPMFLTGIELERVQDPEAHALGRRRRAVAGSRRWRGAGVC